MRVSLDAQLAALATLSLARLRVRWTEVADGPIPRVSAGLLRLAIAYALQEKVHGGLSRKTSQRLDQIAVAKTRTADAQPGMRLVREWQGKLHVVTIGEDGVIMWNEKHWRSLSEVARAITGTRWSGPAFFGLKQKQKRQAA
ncbi:DUF2924 domain-containing protein [Sphingomonas colocasiae]|uniref:DUF2924 domain-containing protein n=1 Tax=Sphingomonas colocasiae TaxID=1848973 RepID=A0ABS7PVY1_9SPHN|nr:DUF2924 domain-containing protein [Sphingomonas colocasiae]MBY8825517.1 DUF2924 domain-containing protein [Sphingomonas colocasiae]